jgi:hypothetical protein
MDKPKLMCVGCNHDEASEKDGLCDDCRMLVDASLSEVSASDIEQYLSFELEHASRRLTNKRKPLVFEDEYDMEDWLGFIISHPMRRNGESERGGAIDYISDRADHYSRLSKLLNFPLMDPKDESTNTSKRMDDFIRIFLPRLIEKVSYIRTNGYIVSDIYSRSLAYKEAVEKLKRQAAKAKDDEMISVAQIGMAVAASKKRKCPASK